MNKIVYALIIFLALAVIPVYWLRIGFDNVFIRDGLYLATVLSAVAGGLYALRRYGFKNARSISLILLTGGMACFLFGELVFEYYFFVLKHDIPFPTVGDIFYILSYPMLFGGLINEIRLADVNFKKLNKLVWVVLLLIAGILSYIVYQWGIAAAFDPEETVLGNVVSMSYNVGDIFLILISLFLTLLVWEYRGGKFASIWLFMMVGFVTLLTGDILMQFFREDYHNEVWFWKSLLDTLGMIGYLLDATALYKFGFSIDDAVKEVKSMGNAAPVKPLELKSHDLQADKAPVNDETQSAAPAGQTPPPAPATQPDAPVPAPEPPKPQE